MRSGARHKLASISVMNDDMTMNAEAGPFEGQDRFECRRNIVEAIREAGDLVKIEDYRHSVGQCQRCATIVEPRISTQWFMRMKPLAEPALEAVRDGRIQIIPERFTKSYCDWMENIRDWCISRQLWWGHRIPVWYCDDCDSVICAREDPSECPNCHGTNIHQDEDVLDTWFSSGLWPFSTLGWPDETDDLAYFYPTTVLETAYDILPFWVARMIVFGIHLTGEVPFSVVYLHGLVRNEEGKKISKSMEDAWRFDPLFMIDEYGQDPLRFTLLTGSTPGNDMRLAPARVESNRNFANKIWQAARFVLGNLGDDPAQFAAPGAPLDPATLANPVDRWIVSRFHRLVEEATRLLDLYQMGEAGRQMYDFMWGEYCDWYIEMTKVRLQADDQAAADDARRVLVYVLDGTLKLLHPYMPFVTETIWQYLPHVGNALIVAPWPQAGAQDAEAELRMSELMDLVRAIRNARSEHDVEPGRRIAAQVHAAEQIQAEFLAAQGGVVQFLARVDGAGFAVGTDVVAPEEKALTLVVGPYECYLPLAALVDLDQERARLTKELEGLRQEMARGEKLLANPGFVQKAPEAVVQKERDKLAEYGDRCARLEERLGELES